MKRFLLILTLALFAGFAAKAQDDDNDKIRDKMREFIQKRMNLSKNEAERFTPVFIRYFKEWRQTIRENKGDNLVRTQRIAELRIRYRTEFKDIVGEKRSNEIFENQDRFVKIIKQQALENKTQRPIRNRSLLIE
jgi:hypothetical protein